MFLQNPCGDLQQWVGPAVFYLHPFELDTEELCRPLPDETWKTRFVRLSQGLNRGKTEAKLRRLLADFEWTSARGRWLFLPLVMVFFIEVYQAILPWRSFGFDDLVWNTVGLLFFLALLRWHLRQRAL